MKNICVGILGDLHTAKSPEWLLIQGFKSLSLAYCFCIINATCSKQLNCCFDNSSSLIQTILSVSDLHRIGCLYLADSSRTFDCSITVGRESIPWNITLPRRIPYLIYNVIVCIYSLYVNCFLLIFWHYFLYVNICQSKPRLFIHSTAIKIWEFHLFLF